MAKEPEDKTSVIGIALRASEWAQLQKIADEVGMKRGALLSYAVRWFIKQYLAGSIETVSKRTLKDL
jgi:hypothetical protein